MAGRIRESCEPCRRRKSRCDKQRPCSSCSLRGTESDCGHTVSIDVGHPSTSSSGYSKRYQRIRSPEPEMHRGDFRRLQRAIVSLEARLIGSTQANVERESTRRERDSWEMVRKVIPHLSIVEVLLEFLLQECDWLYHGPDLISSWTTCLVRQACSPVVAGSLMLSIAIPSYLLGCGSRIFYRLGVDLSHLHTTLAALAESLIPERISSIAELQLATDFTLYCVYSGQGPRIGRLFQKIAQAVESLELTDETTEGWVGLNNSEQEQRRLITRQVLIPLRFAGLRSGSGEYTELLQRPVGPTLPRAPLSAPIRLPRIAPHPDSSHATRHITSEVEIPLRFRVFRLRSTPEFERASMFRELIFELSEFIPRVSACRRSFIVNERFDNERFDDLDLCLAQTYTLYRSLEEWRVSRLMTCGFVLPQSNLVDYSDPLICLEISQTLCLNFAYRHVIAILLRIWLSQGDAGLLGNSTQKVLHDACLQNAEENMLSLPYLTSLLDNQYGPVITPWVSASVFNSATTFAIPVFHAVSTLPDRHWASYSHHAQVHRLPLWPEVDSQTQGFSEDPRQTSGLTMESDQSKVNRSLRQDRFSHLPPEVYSRPIIRRYAKHILVILDAMRHLKASPLGAAAEARLTRLVQETGINGNEELFTRANSAHQQRHMSQPPCDSGTLPSDHIVRSVVDRAPVSQDNTAAVNFHSLPMMDAMQWAPTESVNDQYTLEQLLNLEPALWANLLLQTDFTTI